MLAIVHHDLERLRAVLPERFVFHDHRRTGVGRLEGAAAFIGSLAALFEQSGDAVVEPLYTIAADERGFLEMAHVFGTLAASGGPFEGVYVRLGTYRNDPSGMELELFEPDDVEHARARFAELRAAGAAKA
jgi:hypothetical protein